MADTLLAFIKEVLRDTGQSVSVTTFSDVNDTNFLVDRTNEALADIYELKPSQIDLDGTLTLPASTRKINGVTGLDPYRIYNWSWRINNANGDIKLQYVTKEYIVQHYPQFETYEAEQPQYVYQDGSQFGFYPLLQAGSSDLTIQCSYAAQFTKLSNPTDLFPFESGSTEMFYIHFCAKRDYELFKGLGQPGVSQDKADKKWAILTAKYKKGKRVGFKGYRRYTRNAR